MVGTAVKPSGTSMPPMSKSRPNSPERDPSRGSRSDNRPAKFVRVLISLLLVWHLTAVFLAPLSVYPTSRLVVQIAQQRPMQWYLDVLYLNHGYHFFAPDPGPGHLIRYELLDQSGGVLEQGEFPNRKEQWPRLWYHRHFMLADQAGLPQADEQETALWQRRYLESYARHLLHANEEAQTVRLRRVAHHPLPPHLALQGRKLNDPEGYQTLMEVTQRRSDLPPGPAEQSMMWQGAPHQIGNRPGVGGWTGGMR
jgi:hypothetical protein